MRDEGGTAALPQRPQGPNVRHSCPQGQVLQGLLKHRLQAQRAFTLKTLMGTVETYFHNFLKGFADFQARWLHRTGPHPHAAQRDSSLRGQETALSASESRFELQPLPVNPEV